MIPIDSIHRTTINKDMQPISYNVANWLFFDQVLIIIFLLRQKKSIIFNTVTQSSLEFLLDLMGACGTSLLHTRTVKIHVHVEPMVKHT